jgi:hypothetical protein
MPTRDIIDNRNEKMVKRPRFPGGVMVTGSPVESGEAHAGS